MAILKQTWISGNLHVTESGAYVSASGFRGPLEGTASWAVNASHALKATTASYISPDADISLKSLHVSGGAVVDGNLQVLGDLTYVGAKDLRVQDKLIEINATESGSAYSASADGAGIIIRGAGTPEASILYSKNGDKLVVNKTLEGTITNASEAVHATSALRANSAESADKVKFALSFGAGISKSVASYDGHEAVVIDVNTTEMQKVVVSNSLQAVSASIADKVAKDLTITVKHSGSSDVVTTYNGSAEQAVNVDFTAVEKDIVAHSASIVRLRADIEAMSGGSGTISTQIQNALNKLNADASVAASGTPANSGVFVLSGVAFNEANGKLTSGSATSVEVEQAGAAAAVKVELLGTAEDVTSSMTLHGIRNYVDAKTGDGVTTLSSSVATDIANVMASQSAASQSISQSIAAVDAKADLALNEVEDSDWVTVSAKSNKKQSISVKTQAVADANVTSANGLALAADVKSYVDSKVANKNVTAKGDDWVAASAADNKVTITTNIKAIASATAVDDGLAKASDIKDYISSSVSTSITTLSSSIATKDAAQDVRLKDIEGVTGSFATKTELTQALTTTNNALDAVKVRVNKLETFSGSTETRLDALETANGSAIKRLDTIEAATSSYANSASVASDISGLDSRIDTLESTSATLDSKYVAKTGDTMSGNLNMQTNAIIFGNMKIIWNASEQAIEFVTNE